MSIKQLQYVLLPKSVIDTAVHRVEQILLTILRSVSEVVLAINQVQQASFERRAALQTFKTGHKSVDVSDLLNLYRNNDSSSTAVRVRSLVVF